MAIEAVDVWTRPEGAPTVTGHVLPCGTPAAPYPRFNLVLMVTHDCNLRCSYCYVGEKSRRVMPFEVGRAAIDRAVASLVAGGTLELGFFGGEPLLCAPLLGRLIPYARARAESRGVALQVGLTTNGTVATAEAWSVMMRPEVDLAISHDGLPEVHNRHRRFADGCGTSAHVLQTIHRLGAAGKDFRVVMVVRPDTVGDLSAGILFLRAMGVQRLEPSLDLWAEWADSDVEALREAVARCAEIWREGLPTHGIGWFDETAARLARVARTETARCSFGAGQAAVAPSGRLYPCERLIGADAADNPMLLPGDAQDGAEDFLSFPAPPPRRHVPCMKCAYRELCNTDCRCSNYVRTGECGRPDALLCALNRSCIWETARVLGLIRPEADVTVKGAAAGAQ